MSRADVEAVLGPPDGMQQAAGRIGYQYIARRAAHGPVPERFLVFERDRLVEWGEGEVRATAGPAGPALDVTRHGRSAAAGAEPAAASSAQVAEAAPAAVQPPGGIRLPSTAQPRIKVRFSGDEASAATVASRLRGVGFAVDEPERVAAAGAAGVAYFFIEDQPAAARVARLVGDGDSGPTLIPAPPNQPRPRPGTIIVNVDKP